MWHHIICVSITEDEYKTIDDLKEKVQWICSPCQGYLLNIKELLNWKVTGGKKMNISKALNDINQSIERTEESLQQLQNKIECTSRTQASYSDVTKRILGGKIQQNNLQGPRISHKKTVVIKPKRQQDKRKTNEDIKKKINPTIANAPVKFYKETRNGSVIIKSDTPENAEKLKQHAEQALGDMYEVDIREQKNPRLKIVGLNSSYPDGTSLINDLKILNRIIDENDKLRITYQRQSKRSNKWTVFAETGGNTFLKLANTKLDIGWGLCYIYEDIGINKCYKCSAFGHKTANCIMDQKCSFCNGNHPRRMCEEEHPNCPNCSYANQKFKQTYTTNHDSETEECPIYAKKIRIARESINYEATLN